MVYLEAAIQWFFLKIVIIFRHTWGIPVGGPFPAKFQTVYLPLWWKWASLWVFLKSFAYFIIYCVNGCFGATTLGGCFIILSTLFILILYRRKVSWRALFAGGFLINNRHCVSSLLNINSALAV